MIDVANCPPEVQALKEHADQLQKKIGQARERGKVVPFSAPSTCANALGCVAAFVNQPMRQGRPAVPPTIDTVKYIDWGVLDAIRQIAL